MRVTSRAVEVRTFASDLHPEITTESPDLGDAIAWADAHPIVWKIVTSRRSRTFGLGSSTYLGWAQTSKTSEAVLERVATFRRELEDKRGIWRFRAEFALAHHDDKGFTGGLFQEWCTWTDGKSYPRGCAVLDYTPKTLDEVVEAFLGWVTSGPYVYENRTHVTVSMDDKKEPRTVWKTEGGSKKP